jgi:hypothetical protein
VRPLTPPPRPTRPPLSGKEVVAQRDALVADVNAGTSDQLLALACASRRTSTARSHQRTWWRRGLQLSQTSSVHLTPPLRRADADPERQTGPQAQTRTLSPCLACNCQEGCARPSPAGHRDRPLPAAYGRPPVIPPTATNARRHRRTADAPTRASNHVRMSAIGGRNSRHEREVCGRRDPAHRVASSWRKRRDDDLILPWIGNRHGLSDTF